MSLDAGQEAVHYRERVSRGRRRLPHRDPLPADSVLRQALSGRHRPVPRTRTQRHGRVVVTRGITDDGTAQRHGRRLREALRGFRDVRHGSLLQRLLLVPERLFPWYQSAAHKVSLLSTIKPRV